MEERVEEDRRAVEETRTAEERKTVEEGKTVERENKLKTFEIKNMKEGTSKNSEGKRGGWRGGWKGGWRGRGRGKRYQPCQNVSMHSDVLEYNCALFLPFRVVHYNFHN